MPIARRDVTAGIILVAATIACGLAAGFFYAYEVSVSRGLALVDDAEYINAMQSINDVVRNAAFSVSFFGTLPLMIAALLIRPARRRGHVTLLIAAGLALYLIGAFIVTAAFNVPMNEDLATHTDLAAVDVAAIREDYEGTWNAWNLVRTLAATAALGCLATALLLERTQAMAAVTDRRREQHA